MPSHSHSSINSSTAAQNRSGRVSQRRISGRGLRRRAVFVTCPLPSYRLIRDLPRGAGSSDYATNGGNGHRTAEGATGYLSQTATVRS